MNTFILKQGEKVRVSDQKHARFGQVGQVVATHTYPETGGTAQYASVRFGSGEMGEWLGAEQLQAS